MAVDATQRASIVAAATTTTTTTTTISSCCDSFGSPASAASECKCCFTDSEWAAARELVRLSAGSAPPSPSPFIPARPLPPAEVFHVFSRVRRQRRRSLASLYVATSPVGGGDGGDREVTKRGAATAYGGCHQNKTRRTGIGRSRSPSVSAVLHC